MKNDHSEHKGRDKPKIVVSYLSRDILKRTIGDVTAVDILHRFLAEEQVRAAFYYCISVDGQVKPVAIGTYPEEWLEIYANNGYIGIDPIAERAFSAKAPYVWSEMQGLTDRQKLFMKESIPWVGSKGVTIPLGTEDVVAGISVTSDDDEARWREKLPNVIWNASIIGQKINSIVLKEWKAEDKATPLSRRHVEYLSYIASGLEVTDIATATHTSANAVRRVLDSVQRKLKVNSHSQAVAKAATMGQIML